MKKIVLILLTLSFSSVYAQKVVINKTGGEKVKLQTEEVDSIAFPSSWMKVYKTDKSFVVINRNDVSSIECIEEVPGRALPYSSTNIKTDWVSHPVSADDPWIPGSSYVQATGYQKWKGESSKTNREVEGYYISPSLCTKVDGKGVQLGFDYTIRYTNSVKNWQNYHKIYVSKDYDGNPENFSEAKWEEIFWDLKDSPYADWTLYPSGDIQLPAEYVGQNNVHIALWFYANNSYSTTWELKNLYVREGGEPPAPLPSQDELCKQKIETPALSGSKSVYFIQHSTRVGRDSVMTYCLEYDVSRNHSRWIAFRFDDKTRKIDSDRGSTWYDDPKLPQSYWQGGGTYKNGVRGHLCASHDRRYSQEANDQTFYMTNMSPMKYSFNGYYWPSFENHVQNIGRNTSFADTLYVVKGGSLNDAIGTATSEFGKKIPIPGHYYIALLKVKNGKYAAMAFWVTHVDSEVAPTNEEVRNSVISIDELEKKTGIDFFHNLPDEIETEVEASFNLSDWNL